MASVYNQSLVKTLSIIGQQRVSSKTFLDAANCKKSEPPGLPSEGSTNISSRGSVAKTAVMVSNLRNDNRRLPKSLNEKTFAEQDIKAQDGIQRPKLKIKRKTDPFADILSKNKENCKPNTSAATKSKHSPKSLTHIGVTFGDFLKKKEETSKALPAPFCQKGGGSPKQCSSPELCKVKPLIIDFSIGRSSPRSQIMKFSNEAFQNSNGFDSRSWKEKSQPSVISLHKKTLTKQASNARKPKASSKTQSQNMDFLSFERYFESNVSRDIC